MTFLEMTERAKEELAVVTGLKPVAINATFRDEKGWHICLEMLEMKRIPDSTDLLGDYEVLLDDKGDMLRFQRKRSHLRGAPLEEEEALA